MGQYIISIDADVLNADALVHPDAEQKAVVPVAYELTDFTDSRVLDNKRAVVERVEKYRSHGIPEGSVLMGSFADLSIFSRDEKIRSVSFGRMRQSLVIAQKLSVTMVLFYVNAPSCFIDLPDFEELLQVACKDLQVLIEAFPQITFCFENRSEAGPALFLELFEKLGEYRNVGFCLNYCRAALSPTLPDKWAETLQPYLQCLRISDSHIQAPGSQPEDNLEARIAAHKEFYEKYFSSGKILLGYHDLHDSYGFEDEIGSVELLEENPAEKPAVFHQNSPEEMLERIFFYMNQLVGEKEFSSTILLLTDMGRTLANSERASFWFWDRKKKQYWTIVALGRDKIVIDEGSGIVGASIQNNEVLIINEPYSDKRFCIQVDLASGFVTRSILCIPVIDSKGRVIGAFQAVNKLTKEGYGKFDQQDVHRLAMSAAYCGRTLESYLLYQETLLDALTGLKNRRGFWEFYEEQVEASSENHCSSIIICDVDFFKLVNDTYGHAAGDQVLVSVADILKEEVGNLGGVARWGGEEFLMVLKDYDLDKAADFAEKVRLRIEGTTCVCESQRLKITMSFGVAQIDPQLTIEKNVEIADKKLYRAKENGRNQVVS